MSGRNGPVKRFMQSKRRENKPVVNAPKGFDILLGDAVARLHLNDDDIARLGQLTATRRSGLAHATIGHEVWYRERQLRDLFNKPVTGVITGSTLDVVFIDEITEGEASIAIIEKMGTHGEQAQV